MAGTATNFDTAPIIVDVPGQVWAGLAVPGAGARMTLHTDGTPDSTANPNAIHLGFTEAGAKININSTITKHYADEYADPIKASVEVVEGFIEGEFLQILDEDVLKKMTAPFGTYATGSGYKEFSLGRVALSYTSVALIFPSPMDVTKFAVMHLYNALNEAGVVFGVSRKDKSKMPFKFVGYGLTSRATTDTLGKLWWQV